jgi:peptide/nickel transport system substrate-binding protein
VRAVRTDDRRRRVVVELRRRDSTFPNALADTAAGLVPGTTPVRRAPRRPPPGIGPYVVGSVAPSGPFSLRRRRGLHLPGIPGGNLDRIAVRIVPNRQRQVRAVIAGSLDYSPDAPPTDLLPLIRSKYRDRYEEHRTLSSHWLAMNSRRKPFDDERVRRAVDYAIDGAKLARLTLGFLEPSCNLLPPDLPGFRRLEPCPYGSRTAPADLVKARALIDRAGARGARVTLLASREGEDPAIAGYLVSTLTKIGLRARADLVAGAVRPRRRDQAWLVVWRAGLPHPAEPLRLVRGQDAAVDVETAALAREPLDGDHVLDDWAGLDRRVVDAAYVAPLGSDKRSTLLSERLDFANCSRFHPVYGSDWSSFCLR